MRRIDGSQKFSNRAYYFGGMALITILIDQAIFRVQLLTERTAPISLTLFIGAMLLLLLIAGTLSVFKSLKEPYSKKKITGFIFAFITIAYYLYLFYPVFFK